MRFTTQTLEFSLSAEGIDIFSDWLEDVQAQLHIERRNRMRVRLQLEDIALRMSKHVSNGSLATATCEIKFGRPRVRIEIVGDPYNPLAGLDSELGDWESSLCTAIGLTPQYVYDAGKNVVRLALPHNSMNPVARIAVALVIGATAGLLGYSLIPAGIRTTVVDVLLQPMYNMWNRLLNAISGPIIFLTVITTMLNTRRITERGGNSMVVIVRYFAISILLVAISLICVHPLFPIARVALIFDPSLIYNLLDSLLLVVPSNMFDPFVESNTSQLLFIALALGIILVRLGSRVEDLHRFFRQANVVGLQMAGGVSWLVPIFSAAFLCLELWLSRSHGPIELWEPLLASLVTSLAIMALALLYASQRLRVNPLLLVKKLRRPFFLALKTGSLDDSLSETQASCISLLGVNKDYVKAGLPQGLVLYMPISAVGTIIFTLFVAHTYAVQGHSIWYVSAIVMAVVVFVATPPVPGANLLAYVVFFSTLGIPSDALLDAMIFDIIFGIFAGAANQAMLQLEMITQASRFGLLDKSALRRAI